MTLLIDNPSFYRAATLRERVETLRSGDPATLPEDFDEDLAQRELEAWRALAPFDREEWFSRRLRIDGLTREELFRVLGEPIERVRERSISVPPWLEECESAFRRGSRPIEETLPAATLVGAGRTLGFLAPIEPLLRRGIERLSEGSVSMRGPAPVVRERLAEMLLGNLPWRIHQMLARALVLELNVARLEGTLEGDSSEARFESFLKQLRRREVAVEILAQYPVLLRSVARKIDYWVTFQLEFLGHLQADWEAIAGTFFPHRLPGSLVHVDAGAGDVHRRARSVLIATFETGDRLVYKPRSLAVEAHFQDLLAWIDERAEHPPLRKLRVLDREGHGWVEFVEPAPCSTRDEVQRFYRRQGAYLALLHALEATDFHFENLIAAGEHPVPVDLETIFHGSPRREVIEQPDLQLANEAAMESVLRVGLLPHRLWSQDEYAGIDVSGFGGSAGQAIPDRSVLWEGVGTDEMRASRTAVTLPRGKNLPTLGKLELNPSDHVADISRGFEEMYRLLCDNRDDLLADEGPLQRFAGDQTRSVLRATRTYGLLLTESLHPDFQRDSIELERFLDRLWAVAEQAPELRRIIHAERDDLLNGDVPFFVTRPDSRDLWTTNGERIVDFWGETGLELVARRIRSFGDKDLAQQLWFIKLSMAGAILAKNEPPWSSYRPVVVGLPPGKQELRRGLLDAARRVGDHLEKLAISDGNDATWIVQSLKDDKTELVPLQGDFYGGLCGVIHFLAYLGSVTKEPRYTNLARTACRTFLRRLAHTEDSIRLVGGFDGWGGILYALSHWIHLWDDTELRNEAETMLDALPAHIDSDEVLDIIGGAAGCIAGLLSLHRVQPSERILDLARRCGDRIVARATPMETGVTWLTELAASKPAPGFSHGPAGINWSLLLLATATGETRYEATARRGLAHEETLFVESDGNWLGPEETRMPAGDDLRRAREAKAVLSLAWCYGAPGIGLARLAAMRVLGDDPILRRAVEAAVRTTLLSGFGRNHSLCHGDLGNLDFLLQASRDLGDESLSASVTATACKILASIEQDGWVCGLPSGVESPALMNGFAGIGYGLLRQAVPDQLPSVLSLEPPRTE